MKQDWSRIPLYDWNIQQWAELVGASADAVVLNEARNRAQKASILSVAVMSVIKEHRQDVITGHTRSCGTGAVVSASYFHSLTQKVTARCRHVVRSLLSVSRN